MRSHLPVITSLLAAVAAAATAAAGQSVRYVRASAPAGGDGVSWNTAFSSLQPALDAARADPSITEIWVAAGTYTPRRSGPPDRAEPFRLVSGVSLLGGFAGTESASAERSPGVNQTVLSGDLSDNDGAGAPGFAGRSDNSRHVVEGDLLTSGLLDGFTIRGGNFDLPGEALGGGGGVYLDRSSFQIVNCAFTGNVAGGVEADIGGFGGALLIRGGDVSLTDCRFDGNRGSNGGALGITGSLEDGNTQVDCLVSMERCTFTGNFSAEGLGGAIWSATGDPLDPMRGVRGEIHARDCAFTNNTAEFHGAWLEMNATVFDLDGCEFVGNSSRDFGGALSVSQTVGLARTAMIRRCRFTGNGFAQQRGAAVFAQARPTMLDSCTFADNMGVSVVHSQPVVGFFGGAKELELRNCEIRDNTGTAVFGLRNPSVVVSNCTIVRNPSTIDGGLAGGIEASAAVVEVNNTILWGNHRAGVHDQNAQVRSFFAPPTLSHCIVEGLEAATPGIGNTGLDPVFVSPTDLSLAPGSPAIDAASNDLIALDALDLDGDGSTTEPVPFDLAGAPRRADVSAAPDCPHAPGSCGAGPIVDIGALEAAGAACAADLNGDGQATVQDLFDLLAHYFSADPAADFNHSGDVSVQDIFDFLAAFFAGC